MDHIVSVGLDARLRFHRPRYHIVHYYGVLAPAAKWRRDIVPDPPPLEQCSHGSDTDDPNPPRKNYTWATTDGAKL